MKADLKNQQLLELENQTKQLEVDAQILFEQRLVQYQEKMPLGKQTSLSNMKRIKMFGLKN
nr:hypothetical protein QOL21_07040 [Acholeplasma laidlawii]